MKKIITMLMAITLAAISFTGCSEESKSSSASEAGTENVSSSAAETEASEADNADVTEASEENEEPALEVETPSEIPYRMAQIHKGGYVDGKYSMTELWIAVEILDAEWQGSFDVDPFEITYNATGQSVSELDDINALMNDELFVSTSYMKGGYICQYDHLRGEEVPEEYAHLAYPEDRLILTLCIESNREIGFDDFDIDCTLNHYPSDAEVTTTLEYNSDISEITTSPEFIHNANLFEIDGYYYVMHAEGMLLSNNKGFVSELNDGEETSVAYKYFELKCINSDSAQTFIDSLEGKFSFVYGSQDGYFDKETFENPDYLTPIEMGEGYADYLEIIDDKDGRVAVGLQTMPGYTFDEESEEYKAIENAVLCYTADDGRKIYFYV